MLINYGKRKEEVLNYQRALKEHEELNECKFQPNIAKKSEAMVRNRSQLFEQASGRSADSKKGSQKFESLYQDAMRRNERQLNIYAACIDAECTFQPELENNKINRRRFSSGSRDKRVFERLSQGLNSSRERSQMMMANS